MNKNKKPFRLRGLILSLAVCSSSILPFTRSFAAQCNSMAAAALTPLRESSPISWSMELNYRKGSVDYIGYNKESEIWMALFDLEWMLNENSRLVLEVGTKHWNRSGNSGDGIAFQIPGFGHLPYGDEDWRESRHSGLREAFFEHGNSQLFTRIGLQSMASRDGVLLDERVLGAFLDYQLTDNISLQFGTGTVDKDFSRLGKFCATRHSYRPLSGYYADSISDELGKSNLMFLDIFWKPDSAAKHSNNDFQKANENADDGFQSFENTSSGNNIVDAPEVAEAFQFNGVGLNLFSQFGDAFNEDAIFLLSYAKLDLWNNLKATLHLGSDLSSDSSNFTTGLVADYSVIFDQGGSLSLDLGYWYVRNADQEGRFYPAFSNLLLGEVSKIDMTHAPVLKMGFEYTLPTVWPVFLGMDYISKPEGEWLRETDFQIGFRPKFKRKIGNVELGQHLSIVGTYFKVDAATLDETFDGWRAEIKWAF